MDVYPDIAVISANLGDFDKPVPFVEQSVPYDFHFFTDEVFPPRIGSMTSRLQARIPKLFSWQMIPGYKYYLWIDSSCTLIHNDSVRWFMKQLGDADIAVFKHPHRQTVGEEADYLKYRLSINCPYITPRYKNEDIDGQLAEVDPEQELYATTVFIYRNNSKMRHALKEWWYNVSRYHAIDQLSLPFVLFEHDCIVNVIEENYLKCEYLTYVRQ